MKTSIFEHTNDISTLKAGHANLDSNMDEVSKEIEMLKEMETNTMESMTDLKLDLTNLKTGVASLSTTVFNLKSQVIKNILYCPSHVFGIFSYS